jgi:hypothetical protein
VADWVLIKRRAALLRAMGLEQGPDGDIYSLEEADPEPSREEQAIEAAAKRSNPSLLASLIEDADIKLSPVASRLAAEFLRGERKRQRGRPKMSSAERAAKTPTHDAANYYLAAIEQVLREEYPSQSRRDHRDRALFIVSRMSGVSVQTLTNYLSRPKRGAHKIPKTTTSK